MKKQIAFTFLFLNIAFHAKTQIKFTVNNNQINSDGDSIKVYPLPLTFQFDVFNFKNKGVEIWDSTKKQIVALKNSVFGKNISKDGVSGNYLITILSNDSLKNNDEKINIQSFTLKIDGIFFGPFHKPIGNTFTPSGPPPAQSDKLGYIYYDVLKLNKLLQGSNGSTNIKEILQAYGIKKNTDSALKKNPLLNDVFGYIYKKNAPQGGNLSLSNLASSAGGMNITSVADGFTKFIVKRTKEELNAAFFDKFKESISKSPDLQSVFPQTYNALVVIGDEIYNYQAYIQTLRESFEKDLSAITEHLPSIIENHPGFFAQYPELSFMVNSSCYIATQLRDKEHPGEILANFPLEDLDAIKDPTWNKSLKGSLQTLQLISESLKDTASGDNANYWISAKQLQTLTTNTVTLKIYFGLLRLRASQSPFNNIPFDNTYSFVGVLDSLAFHYNDINLGVNKYKNYISGFLAKANQLNTMIKNYQKKSSDSLAIEQYYSYFDASINLLQYCVGITKLPLLDKLPLHTDKVNNYFEVAHSTGNMVLDVNRRNYAAAVVNASSIFQKVFVKYMPSDEAITSAEKTLEKVKKEEISNSAKRGTPIDIKFTPEQAAARDTLYKAGFYNSNVVQTFFKLGTFMATFVQAKSSGEVSAAIETFALPQGSSRIKRESKFNVSLNAYCGLFAGGEQITKADNSPVFSYGLTAPIGISTGWGARKFLWMGSPHWSYSLFISVVDIGAIAAFRFQNDSIAQIPTIQLKNIISPGAFFSIGIPKSPISFNFGAQIGPNLRKVTSTTNDYSNNLYIRYSVSICVDLPMLNFYTKSK